MRKKYALLIIALFLAAFFMPYGFCEENKANPQIPLSLKDAVSVALRNNKDIRIEEQELEISRAGIIGARSEFLPKVNLSAGYTRNSDVLRLSSGSLKKDAGVFSGYKNDNKLGISLNETLYNGVANIANLKQAQLGLKAQEETLRSRKLDTEFETKRLYYGLLLAYETERITQGLVNQAESHYEDVKNKYSQGAASKFELLQSKVQVSKVTPELVKAKNASELIAAELKKLLGLKMRDSIAVKEKLAYSLIQIEEGEFLKYAYLNKPEMILKSLGIDIGKWQIESAKALSRPRINADLGYNYRSNNPANMFNRRHSNWSAGVIITIPVFDGFSSKAKVDEARARYTQAGLEKEDLVDQIAVDVRRACLDLKQAEAIINSQKDNLEEAREALRIAGVSYDNGVATNLEVFDAQVSLSEIEENLSEGTYDYLMARAFLDRTTGQEFLEEAKNEKKD